MFLGNKVKLSDCVTILGDGLHGTPIYDEAGEYFFINGNNLVDGYIVIKDETRKVSYSEYLKYKKDLNGRSLLISINGTIGNVAEYNGEPVVLGKSACYFNVKKDIDKKYIKYVIQTPFFKAYLHNYANGSTIKNVSLKQMRDYEFNLPDILSQRKISQVLSTIDDKIKNNLDINDNLLNQAITLFNSFTDGKEKNGCIGDYCKVKSGFAFKSNWWTEYGVKVVKIGSINQDELDLNSCSFVDQDMFEKAKEFCVVGGDLLIAMTGATIGKFTMVPSTNEPILVNQRVGKFFLGENPIERLPYIYCILKQPDVFSEIINRGQGSAQPNISGGDIMSIPCIILNNELIDKFNKMTQPLFSMLIDNQRENIRLSELRDTLLPKLMSGEIDVSNIKLDL